MTGAAEPEASSTRGRESDTDRTRLPIEGMHCAGCVVSVEKALAAVPGVRRVAVNLVTGSASVEHDGVAREPLVAAVERAGYSVPEEARAARAGGHEHGRSHAGPAGGAAPAERAHAHHGGADESYAGAHVHDAGERGLTPRFVVALLASVVLMALSMDNMSVSMPWHTPVLSGAEFLFAAALTLGVLAYSGADYYRGFLASIRRRAPDMYTLIATGATAAFLLSVAVHLWPRLAPAEGGVYFDTATMIIALLLFGRLLEARARRKALSAIAELSALAVREARVLRGGEERLVPVEDVAVGDEIVIRAGEAVPVDGVILEGTSAIDESLVTGESLPVTRGPGDSIVGSTVNGNGLLRARVTATGEKTLLATIRRAVLDAQAGKAPIQRLADRIAAVFVPAVFVVALVTAAVWAAGGPDGLPTGLVRAVAVLMIACPCALGLATPMALVVGIGRGARAGILFRDGEVLERAARLRAVVFDKTGTLTEGTPRVTEVVASPGFTEQDVVALAAAVESGAGHPLGAAILAHAESAGIARPRPEAVEAAPGLGVAGRVGGRSVLVGSARFLAARGIALPAPEGDGGPGGVLVAVDGRLAGTIRVADRLRPEAPDAIAALRRLGASVAMITGDAPAIARAIGEPLGLDPIVAGVLPAGKADAVRRLGPGVGMVGDGVNDAPALAVAEVGIAMPGGTDVARAASGVTLVRPDLRLVPAAIVLARKTRAAIHRNLLWAFLFNVIGIPLAAGLLEPVWGLSISPEFAAFAMAMSSVIVVLSSLALRGGRLSAGAAAALVAVGLAAAGGLAVPAPARADDLGENPFEVSGAAFATPGDSLGDYRIEVRFDVPSGHYLYRERMIVAFPSEAMISEPVFAAGVVKYDKFEERELEIYPSATRVVAHLRASGRAAAEIFPLIAEVEYQGCTHEFCYFPQSESLRVAAPAEAGGGAVTTSAPGSDADGGAVTRASVTEAKPPSGGDRSIEDRVARQGYLGTFFFVFVSGILLSFTPCVFPMIPITVSVIGARGASSLGRSFSLSMVYVIGMALTYAALGVFAATTGALFGSLVQHPVVVGIVVFVLTALALSMFGLYEIQVPPALAAKLQGRASGGHGFVGVFFMGIVAGLVASPCVGPVILGLLVYIATTHDVLLGFSLLLTLGLGMGVLFLVLGTFSGALSAMPRAGMWMDRVKELFGVLLIGMALYFLRPLLDPILFALLVGVTLLVLAGFGGVFEPGASGALARLRQTALLLFLAVGIALVGGAVREAGILLPKPQAGARGEPAGGASSEEKGIAWVPSEAEGLEAARAAGRPVMIDFTARWCLVCHEIDEKVFRDPRVVAAAKDYVAIRLDFTKVDAEVKALQAKYAIRGLPTILFLDREGRVRDDLTVTGAVTAEGFLERMRSAAT